MHQSGWTYLYILGGLAITVVALWLLGKLFPGTGNTAAANALMRAEVFFNPSREHEEKEDQESGDPPETGI